MKGGAWLVGLRKEARALLPTWTACALALGAIDLLGDRRFLPAAALVYVLGSVTLGAWSIGHEHTNRTLAALLAQPSDRRRTLFVKLGVLLAMLVPLAIFTAGGVAPEVRGWAASGFLGLPVYVVPMLWAALLAPLLTMWCRNPLAGVVFSIAIPGLLWLVDQSIGVIAFGRDSTPESAAFQRALYWRMTLALSALGAAATWWTFMRLEAVDGRGADLSVPRWLGGSGGRSARIPVPRTLHPLRALAAKELRLQQMTVVVAALYVACCLIVTLLERVVPDFPHVPLAALTTLYAGLLAMLVGSLASAEERQFGTLDWHLLLPIAMWKQWLVKVGVAIGLALLLGAGLPILFNAIRATGVDLPAAAVPTMGVTVLLTCCTLYVSSVSSSGVRALAWSIPVIPCLVFVSLILDAIVRGYHAIQPASRGRSLDPVLVVGLGACGLALLLRFAFENHRSAERQTIRVVRHIGWMLGFVVMGLMGLIGRS